MKFSTKTLWKWNSNSDMATSEKYLNWQINIEFFEQIKQGSSNKNGVTDGGTVTNGQGEIRGGISPVSRLSAESGWFR